MPVTDEGQQAVIDAVMALLRVVEGVHGVEDQPGGVVSWAKDARPERSYWEVDCPGFDEKQKTAGGGQGGGRYQVDYRITIEGWTPFDYSRRTSRTWRALVDRIRATLRTHRGLDGHANSVSLSRGRELDYESFTGGEQKPRSILCHHALIEITVSVSDTYAQA